MPRHNQGPYLTDKPNEFGVYEIRWTENGRSKRRSTGQADYRKAQRVFGEFLIALDEAEKLGPQGQLPTMAQILDGYLTDKTELAARDEKLIKAGLLKAWFGHLTPPEIEDEHVSGYLAARAKGLVSFKDDEGRVRGGLKAGDGTVRGELSMLVTAVNHAIKRKRFRDGQGKPALRAEHRLNLELPPPPEPRDRWLSRAEASALLDAAQPDPAAPLTRAYRYIATMLYTAARKETVYNLTWDRIFVETDPAKIARGDYGKINFQAPGRRITKKRRGWVPIGAELHPIFLQAKREAKNEWFLGQPGEPIHPFRAAAKRAGLCIEYDDGRIEYTVSPHVLRHTFGTWAAQDGVSLYEIAGIMHDSIATIEKNYLHHTPEHLRKAVNRKILGSDERAAA